ncbi:hypothetical protein [Maricaulis sp.]|uniref:hypothetical protein n=1 Tax=Maricaulis sp. TaxID=1486257 RepID=UPI00260F088A|nr:hypothetical protein [Maricaulis sp.]MDF1768404.1 hypothetical protein [Maricaulis sp.]
MSSWKTISCASLLAALLGGTAAAQNPIEVEQLDALDPLEVALTDRGLGDRLWSGTDRDMAEAVLTRLPGTDGNGYASEALGDTARLILLSGGRPPAAGRGDARLAELRVDRLLAAGGPHDAFDLLERTPSIHRRPSLAVSHAELGFALGETDRACQTANALIENRDAPDWLRRRAFCLALDGQGAAAELTAELARAASRDDDFDARLFAMTLGTPVADNVAPPDSGLDFAMSRHLVDPEAFLPVVADDAPAWLASLVHRPIYEPVPVEDGAAALEAALALSGPDRHHALEDLMVQAREREVAGQALGYLLSDEREAARFIHVARHHGREIQTLPVTAATLEHGYDLALAAVIVGDLRSAARWRDALIDGPPRRPGTAERIGQPILETADGRLVYADGTPVDAVEPELEWEAPSPRRMVALDLALAIARDALGGGNFDAVLAAWLESQGDEALGERLALAELGARLPGSARLSVLGLDEMAGTPDLAVMEMSQRAGARAESTMLAVSLLNRPETSADPVTFSRAIAALDAAGLRDNARALVLERVIARAR